MKVEQDLRIAIKAAANASKNQDKSKSDRQLIEDWIKKNPAKAAKARAFIKRMRQVITEYAAAKTKQEAEKVLAKYGIVWK